MTGSDSEEAGHVSQADLATFRQDVENEMAQPQAALHRAVNDLADTTRALAPVGGGGSNGGPGSQPGSPAAGVPRPGHGASSIALLCQPIDGGPVGAETVGSPVPGATPPDLRYRRPTRRRGGRRLRWSARASLPRTTGGRARREPGRRVRIWGRSGLCGS